MPFAENPHAVPCPERSSPSLRMPLHLLKDALLELPLNLLAVLVGGGLAVQRHQGTKVELGLLEQLNLADVHL